MAGKRQIDTKALITTARKIDRPPIRATECEWTFCTPWKSESSAELCNLTCFIINRVNNADATKLTIKENILLSIKNRARHVKPSTGKKYRKLCCTECFNDQ